MSSWMRRHPALVTGGLAALVLAGLLAFGDGPAMVRVLVGFPPGAFLAVLVLTSLAYLLRWVRWEVCLRVLDIRVAPRRSLVVFLAGLLMVVTPGKVGEVWKAWLLDRSDGVSPERVVPVVVVERATDLLGLLGLALLGVGVLHLSPWIVALLAAPLVGALVLLRWRRGVRWILHRLARRPRLRGAAERLEATYDSTLELLTWWPLLPSLGVSLVAWGLEGLAMALVLGELGWSGPLVLPVAAFGLGSVLGALSMLPGGLGVAEASMVGVLVAGGVPAPVAAATTLVVRAGTLWYGALLGFGVYAAHRRSFRGPEGTPPGEPLGDGA